MDFSHSGMRDYVYEILEEVQGGSALPASDLLIKFMADACERIVDEIVFPAIEDALQIVGKTREDMDAAQNLATDKYLKEQGLI